MDLRPLITPTADGFRATARATWREREDLQNAYPNPDTDAFDRWVAINGVLEYPERFAHYWPPVPPRDLRQTGCGGGEAHGHLWTGVEDLEVVASTYETFAERPLTEVRSIFDFGSGCGRLLRWFDRGLPDAHLCGVDVRRASVEWSRDNLRGDYVVGPFDPPTELPDDSFELVVALSLFSHFTREANVAWLRELARVCKPDGLMLVTSHGPFSLSVISESKEHQDAFFMPASRAREILRGLHAETFHYHEPPASWREAIEVGENYGQSFMTEAFAAREWSPLVEILGCVPARLFRFQDVYALRPRR